MWIANISFPYRILYLFFCGCLDSVSCGNYLFFTRAETNHCYKVFSKCCFESMKWYDMKFRIKNLQKVHYVLADEEKNLFISGETCHSHNFPYATRFGFICHHITQFKIITGNNFIRFSYLSQIKPFFLTKSPYIRTF